MANRRIGYLPLFVVEILAGFGVTVGRGQRSLQRSDRIRAGAYTGGGLRGIHKFGEFGYFTKFLIIYV